jgi:hypothetical protein
MKRRGMFGISEGRFNPFFETNCGLVEEDFLGLGPYINPLDRELLADVGSGVERGFVESEVESASPAANGNVQQAVEMETQKFFENLWPSPVEAACGGVLGRETGVCEDAFWGEFPAGMSDLQSFSEGTEELSPAIAGVPASMALAVPVPFPEVDVPRDQGALPEERGLLGAAVAEAGCFVPPLLFSRQIPKPEGSKEGEEVSREREMVIRSMSIQRLLIPASHKQKIVEFLVPIQLRPDLHGAVKRCLAPFQRKRRGGERGGLNLHVRDKGYRITFGTFLASDAGQVEKAVEQVQRVVSRQFSSFALTVGTDCGSSRIVEKYSKYTDSIAILFEKERYPRSSSARNMESIFEMVKMEAEANELRLMGQRDFLPYCLFATYYPVRLKGTDLPYEAMASLNEVLLEKDFRVDPKKIGCKVRDAYASEHDDSLD